jgi:ComF family protein
MLNTFGKYNVDAKGYLVVPVPTATSRVRERSFGHSELLAKKIAQTLLVPYANVLRRLGQTRQLGSKRDERLIQLSSSFAVSNYKKIKGSKILLIDDVVTTGGTLIAATKMLRAAGAKQVDALLFTKRL